MNRSPGLLLLLVPALLALTSTARAQESGLTFLRIGTNAAASALGDAGVAYTRDAFATYWNPAGLAAGETNTAALSYLSWIAGLNTYAVTTRFRAGARGGLGLFVTAQGSGDLEARDVPGEPTGAFQAHFLSAGIAYGRQVGPLRVGAAAKYLSEQIFTEDARGYAVDLGVQADLFGGGLLLGAALQNVGEMNELGSASTELPRLVRVGAAVTPFHVLTQDDGSPLLDALATVDVSYLLPDEVARVHLGLGAELFELVALRAGLVTNDTLRRFSFGAGLHVDAFRFDYAFVPFQSQFASTGHVLTLAYHW